MTSASTHNTLRSVAEISLGRQRSPQHAEGPHMVRYLRAANVKDGVLDLDDVQSMNFTPSEQVTFSLRAGDVLVSEGSGSIKSVGAAAVWRGELEGTICFQNTLLRLRPRAGTDGEFLGWWARSAFGSGVFASIATGANIYHVSAERIRALPIHLPPLAKQRRIAAFLDAETTRIDSTSAAHISQLSLLTERYQSWISELANRLSEKFETVRLRHVLFGIEQGWSPQCDDHLAGEGEWGVVKAGCVNGGVFDPLQHKRLPPSVEPRLQYKLIPGDLLMSRASGSTDLIGSTGIVPELDQNLLLCDKVYRLKVDHNRARSHFIAYMLRTHAVREHVKLGISGAAGMANNLPTPVVRDCILPDAPLAEQDRAIIELNRMTTVTDRTRLALNRQIGLLAERRQALITAAVTGQIDVSTASGRGVDVP